LDENGSIDETGIRPRGQDLNSGPEKGKQSVGLLSNWTILIVQTFWHISYV